MRIINLLLFRIQSGSLSFAFTARYLGCFASARFHGLSFAVVRPVVNTPESGRDKATDAQGVRRRRNTVDKHKVLT